jgi:hypothetical protein
VLYPGVNPLAVALDLKTVAAVKLTTGEHVAL